MKVQKNYSLLIISILIILVIVFVVKKDRPFYLISNFHFNLVGNSRDIDSNPKVNKFLEAISQSATKN